MLLVTILSSLAVVACLMPMSEAMQRTAVDQAVEIQSDSQETTDKIARLSDEHYDAEREERNQDQPSWNTMKYAGDPDMQIKIREIGPGRDILLPVRGSYEQYPKALNQLKDYIKKKNIPTRNRMFSVHNSNPHETIPSEYEWEVGCEIQADADVSVERPFYVRDVFTGKYASCIIDESPDRELPWAVFIAMTVSKGYMPFGPAIKSWNEDPYKESKLPGETEMLLPVVELDNISEGIAEWIETYGQVMKSMDPLPVVAPE
jgi:DNA gyrase inhibitor GyrI